MTYCLRWPNATFNESETSWWMDPRTKKIKPGRPLQSSNNASARRNNVLWKHEKAPQLTTSEHLRAKHTSSKIMRGKSYNITNGFVFTCKKEVKSKNRGCKYYFLLESSEKRCQFSVFQLMTFVAHRCEGLMEWLTGLTWHLRSLPLVTMLST